MNMFKTLTDALLGRTQDSESKPDPDPREVATAFVGGVAFTGRVEEVVGDSVILEVTNAPDYLTDSDNPLMQFHIGNFHQPEHSTPPYLVGIYNDSDA